MCVYVERERWADIKREKEKERRGKRRKEKERHERIEIYGCINKLDKNNKLIKRRKKKNRQADI